MSNSHSDAIPIEELYKRWGFDPDVFIPDEARKEKRLDKVLKLPSWFFEVLGSVSNTDFAVVVGARGAGKSAVRRFIAEHCETEVGSRFLRGNVLCVTIDHDVPYWIVSSSDGKDPFQAFCTEVASLIAIGIAGSLLDSDKLGELEKPQKNQLLRYIERLHSQKPEDTEQMLGAVQSRFSRAYKKARSSEMVNDFIKVARGSEGDLRGSGTDANDVFQHADEDIASLIRISKTCDFNAVYVLIDEIDEYPHMGDPHRAAELIAPVISSLRLLELEGIAFKFFLSEPVFGQLEDMCRNKQIEIRWDRTSHRMPYRLEWGAEDISDMLKKRLQAYSTGDTEKTSLDEFCDEAIEGGIDKQITTFAYRSPRHFIQFAQTLCLYTARVANGTDDRITREVLEQAKMDYFQWLTKELYGESYVNSLRKLKMTEFSSADFAKILKLNKKQCEDALKKLASSGALERIIEIASVKYRLSDPRLLYLMQEGNE